MKYERIATIALTLSLVACGGGDDSEPGPVAEPDNPERAQPAIGGPDGEEFDEPDELIDLTPDPDDQDAGSAQPATCCPTDFRISDVSGTEDEQFVELVGSESPLVVPVEMTFADGVWSASACMPSQYSGTYHYRFVYDDGETSVVVEEANPAAPTVRVGGTLFNDWLEADTCEETFSELHANVEE